MGTEQVSPTPSSNDYMIHPKNHLSIVDMCISLKLINSCKDHEYKFPVVGKVISSKSLSKHSVKRVLLRAWPIKERWYIDHIARSEHSMFRFVFQSLDDRQWVINKGPWSVNGEILILRDWDTSVSIQSISFEFSLWWVQIHGTLIDMKLSESSRWKPFVRVQLSINVNNPLYPGFYLPMESQKPTWVQLKYEKLLYFCFRCGRLGHEREACSEEANTTIANLQGSIVPLFGPWLRVDSKLPNYFIAAIQRAEREVKRMAKKSPSMEAVVQPAQGEVSGDIIISGYWLLSVPIVIPIE